MARPKHTHPLPQWGPQWKAQAEIGFNLADALLNYMRHDTRTVKGGWRDVIIFTKR